MAKGKFLVPDYYAKFVCKGGRCRNCCCDGWTITLTKEEYYRLIGLDCSEELKDKIMMALRVFPDARDDHFAKMSLNFFGECPLRRRSDGWCSLQCECGEKILPSVCRYYPRAPRFGDQPRSCLSNSCEWTVEELCSRNKPLEFETMELSFDFEEPPAKEDHQEQEKHCLALLQDKNMGLAESLNEISSYLGLTLRAGQEEERIKRAILSLKDVYANSPSIGELCSHLDEDLPLPHEVHERLSRFVPDLEGKEKLLLANHFFYLGFPNSLESLELEQNMRGVLLLLAFWEALILKNLKQDDPNSYIDLTGFFFRVAEHSNFYSVVNSSFRLAK